MPEEYSEIYEPLPEPNNGNCKKCVYRSNCGSKNKREARWCDRYRPEIKKKKGKRRK
jgi:hypothetical protein